MLRFRPEVLPFLAASVIAGVVLLALVRAVSGAGWAACALWGAALTLVAGAYFLYFFRDPERVPPGDPDAIVSAGEGRIASITTLDAEAFQRHCVKSGLDLARMGSLVQQEVVRISVFLSPLNVHVNRAPIAGRSHFLGYFPGKHILTINEKSSEENQHNSIYIVNARTQCLLNQIVGPVCRRVVYWLPHDRPVDVQQGERIGMMKFGSRLDLYFPAKDIAVVVQPDDLVRAGETIVARLRGRTGP